MVTINVIVIIWLLLVLTIKWTGAVGLSSRMIALSRLNSHLDDLHNYGKLLCQVLLLITKNQQQYNNKPSATLSFCLKDISCQCNDEMNISKPPILFVVVNFSNQQQPVNYHATIIKNITMIMILVITDENGVCRVWFLHQCNKNICEAMLLPYDN